MLSTLLPVPPGSHVGLAWWIPGMILAGAYSVFIQRRFSARVAPE